MKKSIIAAGATSVALAAMPVVGVFAVTSTPVKDTISAKVDPGCTIVRSGVDSSTDYLVTTAALSVIAGGAADTDSTTKVEITCSDAGWSVRIAPTTSGVVNLTSGTNNIAPGTGDVSENGASYWAYSVQTKIGSAAAVDGPYTALSTSGGDIITASATTTANASTGEFTPTYKVYANASQPSGTYTGGVTYTVASLADS